MNIIESKMIKHLLFPKAVDELWHGKDNFHCHSLNVNSFDKIVDDALFVYDGTI